MPRHTVPSVRHRHSAGHVRRQRERYELRRLRQLRDLRAVSYTRHIDHIDRTLARAAEPPTETPYFYKPLPSYVTRCRLQRQIAEIAAERLGQAGPVFFYDIEFLRSLPIALLRGAGEDTCVLGLERKPKRWRFRCTCSYCCPERDPGYRSWQRRHWRKEAEAELAAYAADLDG